MEEKKYASTFAWKSHNPIDWHFSLNHTPTSLSQRRTRDILAKIRRLGEIITTSTELLQLSIDTFFMLLCYLVK